MLHRLPFSPAYDFVAAKPFELDGKPLTWGDPVDKSKANERLLRLLYEQRRIDPVLPDLKPEGKKGSAKKEAPVTAPAGQKAAPQAPPAAGAPEYQVRENFGRFEIVRDGEVISSHDTAEAAMAQMLAVGTGAGAAVN